MPGNFNSIFKKGRSPSLLPPENSDYLMRALEPRFLLDAAALETAMDTAGQSAHAQFADEYLEQNQSDIQSDGSPGRQMIEDAPALETETPSLETDSDVDGIDGPPERRTDREIVFIDAGIEGLDTLIASLEPGVTIHMLEGDSDGILQIADILSQSDDYDAVHIFSHGAAGALQLGNSVLDAGSIRGQHAEALKQIGSALSEEGDILIYGCNFGEGIVGQRAANLLAQATGADIAASDDITGSEPLSGDWNLEVQSGEIQSASFTLPDWQGILEGFELQPTGQPIIGHLDDGVVGTANTTATWSGAVQFDPEDGNPVQTFDLRATLVGLTDDVSATFETVASGDGSMDDFRVVVTNIGEVIGNEDGQDVLAPGSVSVSWGIFVSGTDTLAPPNMVNLVFKDIEGLAGLPDTRESVAVISDEVVSYTVNASTDLEVSSGDNGLTAVGTQPGTGAIGSQIGLAWASTNQFIVTYTSHTLLTNFDMDGDTGVASFPTPITSPTQSLDLNGTDAGDDYNAIYVNGAKVGTNSDVPVSIVDVDMQIEDFDSDFLSSAKVTLSNPHPGDQINFDTVMLDQLGIFATYEDTGSEISLELDGFALISNYETALRSLSYSNDNPDAFFNRVDDRTFNFEISDGVISTAGVTTTISFAAAGTSPVAGSNVYVEDEDTTIVASIANGLISDDADPQGGALTVIGARDSSGTAIPIGMTHVTPVGAALTINADGSFTYIPAPNYSGNETITYTVSDSTAATSSFATFDIQPVVDDVTLVITQPDPTSDEDTATEIIDVSAFSEDDLENQSVLAFDIPPGVIITDGTFSFEANADETEVDITAWTRSAIRILPVQNSDQDVTIAFLTTNFEVDGSVSVDSQSVTFEVDAVADVPLLIVQQAFGEIDEDVLLANTISVQLFDIDGSEEITEVKLSDIPDGAQILVNSVPIPIVGGEAVFGPLDIPSLVFRPPQTGTDAIYNLNVSAMTTEVSPENGVTIATAERANVGLLIELNDENDPVVAVDDQVSTFAGESVNINVLENDFIPDGTPLVTEINGLPIDVGLPVILPGGQGTVSLSPFGFLIFQASTTFAGEVEFEYTVQDVDLSVDTGTVTVQILPRWTLSSDTAAVEGTDARFTLTIEGGVNQGDTISADLTLQDGTTDAGDYQSLTDAINTSIARFGQDDFSFNGTTLTYSAPSLNYTSEYEPVGPGFIDISPTGTPLNLFPVSIHETEV